MPDTCQPKLLVTLRPATMADLEWLEPFYESLMRPYVELTHPWDPHQFKRSFTPRLTSIIQVSQQTSQGSEQQAIGMFKVERCHDHIYLGDLQIKSAFQGRGIGSQLIRELILQAQTQRLPIRLRVLQGNPALRLYQRLGFTHLRTLDHCYELEHCV